VERQPRARLEPPGEWFIERTPNDRRLADELDRYKRMRSDGWELTVLVANGAPTVIAFGYRPAAARFALGRVA
jgi:hypothetical protein